MLATVFRSSPSGDSSKFHSTELIIDPTKRAVSTGLSGRGELLFDQGPTGPLVGVSRVSSIEWRSPTDAKGSTVSCDPVPLASTSGDPDLGGSGS